MLYTRRAAWSSIYYQNRSLDRWHDRTSKLVVQQQRYSNQADLCPTLTDPVHASDLPQRPSPTSVRLVHTEGIAYQIRELPGASHCLRHDSFNWW